MNRLFTRQPYSNIAIMALAFVAATTLHAQTDVPAAPAAPAAPLQQAGAADGPVFPKPDPAYFTATSPTKEQIMTFLQAAWG